MVVSAGFRKPSWVLPAARSLGGGDGVRRTLRAAGAATVCESARCPNRGECFGAGTATFLILGERCTRRCGFCAVGQGAPSPPDPGEPAAVAEAARRLGLRHAVVTSVTRDDLPDGGASHFAATVRALGRSMRTPSPTPLPSREGSSVPAPPAPSRGEGSVGVESQPSIEVLVPDFGGNPAALDAVLEAAPDVLAHNLETVPRLHPRVRPGAAYERSLGLLRRAAAAAPGAVVKSGLMAGLGERPDELVAAMRDLAAAGCSILTVGQYLQPARDRLPVARYLRPAEFEEIAAAGRAAGIAHVVAGPLVRSSYRAHESHAALRAGAGGGR